MKITKEKLAIAWLLLVLACIIVLMVAVIYSLAGWNGIIGAVTGIVVSVTTKWAIDTLT